MLDLSPHSFRGMRPDSRSIIPDTTLCMIVRDELMNSAGGIERMLRHHIPHFTQVDVADTGSVDGTREKLAELEKEYEQLRVYDHAFDGYGPSRNFIKSKARTRLVAMLDADELITHQDLSRIRRIINNREGLVGIHFPFRQVKKTIGEPNYEFGHNPRIYRNLPDYNYRGKVWENLFDEDEEEQVRYTVGDGIERENLPMVKVPIYHFEPQDEEVYLDKRKELYTDLQLKGRFDVPPSRVKGFKLWKAFNPLRNAPQFN
ncbi:MAG: glycosyltransferase [Nanoarchaeota archaeon]